MNDTGQANKFRTRKAFPDVRRAINGQKFSTRVFAAFVLRLLKKSCGLLCSTIWPMDREDHAVG